MNEQSNQSRVAFDEHGKRTLYDDIEVGADLGEIIWTVTEEDIDKQCLLDDDYHPWYFLGMGDGIRVAPPQLQYRPPRWLISRTYNIRGVFCQWQLENCKPIKAGMRVTVKGRIHSKWIKNEREFVKYEAEGLDEQGDLLFRTGRVHVLDVIKATAPREGAGLDSGIKAEKI